MTYPWQHLFTGFDERSLHSGWRAEFCAQFSRIVSEPQLLFPVLRSCPRAWNRFQIAQQIASVAVLDPWSDSILRELLADLTDESLPNVLAIESPRTH